MQHHGNDGSRRVRMFPLTIRAEEVETLRATFEADAESCAEEVESGEALDRAMHVRLRDEYGGWAEALGNVPEGEAVTLDVTDEFTAAMWHHAGNAWAEAPDHPSDAAREPLRRLVTLAGVWHRANEAMA